MFSGAPRATAFILAFVEKGAGYPLLPAACISAVTVVTVHSGAVFNQGVDDANMRIELDGTHQHGQTVFVAFVRETI